MNPIAIGYVIERPVRRPDRMGSGLVPESFFSASCCLAEFAPDLWAIRWTRIDREERLEKASVYGLGPGDLERVMDRITAALEREEFGWPCAFPSLDLARAFRAEFLAADRDAAILGLGLPPDLRDEFLASCKPSPCESPPGFYLGAGRGEPLAPGGEPLGWEPLGYEMGGSFHSWLCNGIERTARDRFGILPGPNGLIEREEDARKIAGACNREELGEPVPWFPIGLVRYDPGSTAERP